MAEFDFLCKKLFDMKMKIILLSVFFVCATLITYAQTSDEEAEAIVNLLGVQKKEAVKQLVAVSDKDSVAFWKIYNEYQEENKKTAKSRISLYERTVQAYSKMTPAIADSLAKGFFEIRNGQEKSIEKYYGKIRLATNPITAFEFYQAETYLLTQMRAAIMQQVPTYGELQNARKAKQ
jgi:hypothetical protein